MTEQSVFECDATGEQFGARNDVSEFGIKRQTSKHNPFQIHSHTVHISNDKLSEFSFVPGRVEYLGVNVTGSVIGVKMQVGTNDAAEWRSREDVVIDQYEEFFQFIEDEVLY